MADTMMHCAGRTAVNSSWSAVCSSDAGMVDAVGMAIRISSVSQYLRLLALVGPLQMDRGIC